MWVEADFEKYDKMAGFPIFEEYAFLGKEYVETLTHFEGKTLSELLLKLSRKFPETAKEITIRIMATNPGRLANYLN